ncbi:hypothetical protein LR48_Vigan618s001200 [Vigna angularis]|uniref:Uncharacterized protein n=1 Tax=Phaseolus angularis TaxID=3914 RepID=A0A0L9TE92_PHAAN|nr:hypothetical protein LR48_Vigan618s001200 [Vigna angularis]
MESSSKKHNISSHDVVDPSPLVAESGRLPASAACTGGESGPCVKKRRRGSENPCLRAAPNRKLTREIFLPEVIFGEDDRVIRWGRKHVSGSFSKRRSASFMTVKTRRGTGGFLHCAGRKTEGRAAPMGVGEGDERIWRRGRRWFQAHLLSPAMSKSMEAAARVHVRRRRTPPWVVIFEERREREAMAPWLETVPVALGVAADAKTGRGGGAVAGSKKQWRGGWFEEAWRSNQWGLWR